MDLISLAIKSIFIENILLSTFLGMCSFLAISKKVQTSLALGLAVVFVNGLTVPVNNLIWQYLLKEGALTWTGIAGAETVDLSFLALLSYICTIAALVQVVEMFLKKSAPSLYSALGIYLPLITTNCAVLGVTILNVSEGLNLFYSVLNGVFGALGFLLAIVLMAGVRERLETAHIPEPLKGFPSSLIIAGLMSVAFMGFNGLV